MQDKEIDQLFRSKLDSLEVEPSAQLWDNIALAVHPQKRGLKSYLAIAAGLLILLSAGLYYLTQPVNRGKKTVQVVQIKKLGGTKQVISPEVISPKIVEPKTDKEAIATNKPAALPRQKTAIHLQRQVLPVMQKSLIRQPDQQLAQIAQPETMQQVQFVVPDKQTQLTAKTEEPDDTQFRTTAAVKPQSTDAKSIAAAPAKKHRIRSLGDIINVVVSKVDKRKDKLIEFSSENDEDESVVSGLNLGFIKIKKEEK